MPRIKACLGYKQAYDEQNTKEFQFQNFSLTTSSAMVLEGLRQALRVKHLSGLAGPLYMRVICLL